MRPIHIPTDWDDHALLTFEQFCTLVDARERTVRDWRTRKVGPTWLKIEGCGRLYITIAECRRFLRSATADRTDRADRANRTIRTDRTDRPVDISVDQPGAES